MNLYKNLTLPLFVGILVSQSAHSADLSPLNSSLYYDIGGGEVIDFPLTRTSPEKYTIAVDSQFKLPSLCEIWDTRLDDANVGDYLDMIQSYAEGELDELGRNVVEFLITAPATIAVASLQRALPGMYDYSQNLKAQMDVSIDYAKQSCSDVVESMDNNVNPFSGWLTASVNTQWRNEIEDENNFNILATEKEINANFGEEAVQWFGERRGTSGKPINLVTDVVSAGFAANLGQRYSGIPVDAGASLSPVKTLNDGPAGSDFIESRIRGKFPTSASAAEFAVAVLGEQAIEFCNDCENGGFTPGTGLKPRYADERDDLIVAWSALLGGFDGDIRPATMEALKTVSSEKVAITRPVWVALDRMPKQDRDLFIHRLISDVAVERTIDKAIAIRQMLKAGISTTDVQSYEFAKEEANRLADQMKDEVDDFLWEIETQENLASNTASRILQADAIDSLNNLQSIRNYSSSGNSALTSSQGPIK